MSENTTITEKKLPNPQKIKWKNVAYYDTFEEAHQHRLSLDEEGIKVKVRRCGPDKVKYVVKTGTLLKEPSND
tara:strand:+ start:560 stop:778 length:219 start_codon:yes stop_codon:yes gene_type:complete